MKHIKDSCEKADYILVSSYDNVRKVLMERGLDYALVYPAIELKEEYIERYKNRGDSEGFVNFIGENWGGFIRAIEDETFPELIKLEAGQYMSDVL